MTGYDDYGFIPPFFFGGGGGGGGVDRIPPNPMNMDFSLAPLWLAVMVNTSLSIPMCGCIHHWNRIPTRVRQRILFLFPLLLHDN
jgi:hypothetical protein